MQKDLQIQKPERISKKTDLNWAGKTLLLPGRVTGGGADNRISARDYDTNGARDISLSPTLQARFPLIYRPQNHTPILNTTDSRSCIFFLECYFL